MRLESNQRLAPCTEEVAAKVIDGEAILINLATGVYYSMDKVGALAWEMIAGGYTLEQIVSTVVRRYEVSLDQATADVHRLADELAQENLVKPAAIDALPAAIATNGAATKEPYESPVLNIYRDMGDLLALDPPTPGLDTFNWNDPDKESQ